MHDLSDDERDYLRETLAAAHTQLLHELHHADSSEFKEMLRRQVALNEGLTSRLEQPRSVAAPSPR